jgi:hypothetical protein
MALGGSGRIGSAQRLAAHQFLERHRHGDGFSTYAEDSFIGTYIQAGAHSIEGWTSEHPDVTAAVLLAGSGIVPASELERLLGLLIARQTGAGFIESYWWRGPFYATALTVRALVRYRRRLGDERAELLLRALRREQLADGGYPLGSSLAADPFSTALALEILCHLRHHGGAAEREAAAVALLTSQGEDGGWEGDLVMRLPAPDVKDPRRVSSWHRGGGGGNTFVPDEQGIFATALAARALDLWRRSEVGSALSRVASWPTLRPVRPTDGEEILARVSGGR